jgi:hypothetical protein
MWADMDQSFSTQHSHGHQTLQKEIDSFSNQKLHLPRGHLPFLEKRSNVMRFKKLLAGGEREIEKTNEGIGLPLRQPCIDETP